MHTHKLIVEFTTEDPIGKMEIREYVVAAVKYWGGQFHPNENLFNANISNVKVKTFK